MPAPLTFKQERIDVDRDKLRVLRERVRKRMLEAEEVPERIHEACFLAEVIADIDEIGWPDLAVGHKLVLDMPASQQ